MRQRLPVLAITDYNFYSQFSPCWRSVPLMYSLKTIKIQGFTEIRNCGIIKVPIFASSLDLVSLTKLYLETRQFRQIWLRKTEVGNTKMLRAVSILVIFSFKQTAPRFTSNKIIIKN